MFERMKNFVKDKASKTLILATAVTSVPVVAFAEDTDLATITTSMTSVFGSVKSAGIIIVTTAVGMGVTFIGAKWLWGKVRQWLAKV